MSPRKTDGCTWEQCAFTWSELALSGRSWAELEVCQPRPEPDPDAGYTWEDIEKAKLDWQMLTDKQPSWQEWQELIPGGNWEDSLTVAAEEGEALLLQINALNAPAMQGITFVVVYDPAAVSWEEGFPQEKIGLAVNGRQLPQVASHENGELKLHFPIAPEEPWTGIITLLGFPARKAGELTFALKGGTL